MKKTTLIRLSWLTMSILLVTGGFVHASSPVIKDFSSDGGHARNKDNAGDTMYLVRPADKITFKVKAEGADKYEWQVNKKAQAKATGNTFAWTVPDEKGIWEIHLTASNKDGAAHQEWVVSTLGRSEAPVLFDYFCPDRSEKDPWGRPLPKWNKEIARPDYMTHGYAEKSSRTAFGTWVFRRKYGPKGKRGTFAWSISDGQTDGYGRTGQYYTLGKKPNSESWDIRVPSEYGGIRVHCMGRSVMGECCSHVNDDNDDWMQVRIVRTKDGWFYVWFGSELWFDSLANENTIREIRHLLFTAPSLDCVEVYDRTVWPAKSIRFGQYTDDKGRDKDRKLHEVKRKGVIINARGVRLVDIAEAIGDPKIFRYDPAAGTAVCYTDLVITAGAELIIDGEILKMHCDKDGEHQIRVGNCSTIRLNKATVTSDNKFYYLWAFTSACKQQQYEQWGGYPAQSYSGRFYATDSTISNCGNLFIDTPKDLVLKRCKLVDLVEVDIGNYWQSRGGYHIAKKRMAAKGKKGLWFYNRKDLVEFRITDCFIHGKDKPLDITFIGGDDMHKVTISDCDLDNVAARRGYRFKDWGGIGPAETIYMSCTVSLVNCKFRNLKAQGSKAWILPKYYLDVLAVDKSGKPLPDCKVRVINETDNVRHPAENLREKRDWVYPAVTGNGWVKVCVDVNDLTASVSTGKDGHTALPHYKADTLVLTDYVRDTDGQRKFTYTVRVTAPDGRFGEHKGVNPGPDWYRPDPLEPTHTVKVVVNKPAVKPVREDKAIPWRKVKTTKSPWPTFRGPDCAHTGRSPYAGPKKPRLLWRYKTDGEILSSPVIGADGTIYITSKTPDNSLHAVNPDGIRKWRFRITPANTLSPSIGPDGTIYVGASYCTNRRLLAVSPEGKLRWRYVHPGHQHSSPISGPDGTIYYAAGSKDYGYRLRALGPDGKLKWTGQVKGRTGGSWWTGDAGSSPAVAPDGTIYVGGSCRIGAVHAVAADGTLKWAYKIKNGRYVVSSPAISISDKTVYVGSTEGRFVIGTQSGRFLALGFDSSLKWSFRTAGEITSSPAIAYDGTVYFGSRDGDFYAFGKDGQEKWKYKTGDHIYSSPAIDADGKIFFGSHDHYLYCLSPKGKLLWRYLTGGAVTSSPAIGADGTVYVGSSDGYLYAFGK